MAKVNFRTHAAIKSIIGKDLITDDNIAVLELVKNSFDANSKNVEITFKNIFKNDDSAILLNKNEAPQGPTDNTSTIIISDTGTGMSQDDLVNKWLNIAYSEKKQKREDYGRVFAGNKGVGRFSCDRLGEYLDIYTRKDGKEYIHLQIDWKKFEIEDDIKLDIQSIDLEIQKISGEEIKAKGFKGFRSGTILEIRKLRSEWDHGKILSLKRNIEKLINPNQAFKENAFEIEISAPEFVAIDKQKESHEKIIGPVKNRIFETLNFKTTSIESFISEDGKTITTKLQDRGRDIFELIERNTYSTLKNIRITIYYLSTYSKAYFTRQTGIRSVDFGSVSLFINGFRVPPYGDVGDDWLGIEIRKGQGHSRFLGTREVVGRIEIKDDNQQFKIISSRSGIVNDTPFQELTRSDTKTDGKYGYFFKTFRRLERFVVEGIKWDSTTLNEKETRELEKKVLSKSWDESKEQYIEQSLNRNTRALSVVSKIISAKKDEVIKLTIYDDFINEIIAEQVEISEQELSNIVDELSKKKLASEDLEGIIKRIETKNKEVESLASIVKGYSVENKVEELENTSQKFSNKTDELKRLQGQLKENEEKLAKAEEEKRRAEEQLALEIEKNTYLKTSSRSLSQDAKGLVHNIKITSRNISTSVDNLYDKILNRKIKETDILKSLSNIKFQAEKALKISKIITRSNFNTEKNEQIVDVARYITQYIDIYSDIYSDSTLEFEVINKNSASLIRKVSILDISVILDDLISNSEKADATNICLEISNPTKESLKIIFSDDGNGLTKKFLDNPSEIFELGVTTTDGSGIGLNSVKTALKSMKGSIDFIGNGKKLKGATFQITIG